MPPGQRRDFPPILRDADVAIDQWRTEVLRGLPDRYEYAAYLLTAVTVRDLGEAGRHMMPARASAYEILTRPYLSGLQFALAGPRGDLRPDPLVADVVSAALTARDWASAQDAIREMLKYQLARDALVTYGRSGYEIEHGGDGTVRFVDPRDWPGRRDFCTTGDRSLSSRPIESFPVFHHRVRGPARTRTSRLFAITPRPTHRSMPARPRYRLRSEAVAPLQDADAPFAAGPPFERGSNAARAASPARPRQARPAREGLQKCAMPLEFRSMCRFIEHTRRTGGGSARAIVQGFRLFNLQVRSEDRASPFQGAFSRRDLHRLLAKLMHRPRGLAA
jgi:hypothetical protein